MSEYQHYEWQIIDRPLTEAEQAAVNKLSSHIEVSATQAVVTYTWGDFKHDPRQVLARYFDAHFYWANWGTRYLMFRFPLKADLSALESYCLDDAITLEKLEGRQVLALMLVGIPSSGGGGKGVGWVGDGPLSFAANRLQCNPTRLGAFTGSRPATQ